ncbi:alpha/beta hydrolase [Aquimarina sediminis]|uniref:alpha/beta hydrolase n=1 Tax=Aquimarina sediminis TaxID=2070536 RepID=UPI0013E89FEE|nr:carboxylesterase family protein [Aquimarina sediminis]
MKNILTFILIMAIEVSIAQTQYLDSIFSEVNKTTHVFNTHKNDSLQLDYYIASEIKEQVPLLVYVHGGGFSGGQRDSDGIVAFATKLAQHGFAVASVSYRLTMKGIGFGCNTKTNKKIEAIDAASHDVGIAIKYILDHNQEFNIDKSKVILAGGSAGAEAVLNMAYVYEDNTLPADFKYAGVISLAGAITTVDKIKHETAIPTQLFHGTGDILVPYGVAPHHYCKSNDKGLLMLYGSAPIAKRLKGLGSPYYLYSITGGSHAWAELPLTKCFSDIIDFLYHDVLYSTSIRQTERTINTL